MDAYIYQASLWCSECAQDVQKQLEPAEDSDAYPQGPYGDGGGEADTPHHCEGCGCFLENPLTTDGTKYVRARIAEARSKGRLSVALTVWAPFYGEEN